MSYSNEAQQRGKIEQREETAASARESNERQEEKQQEEKQQAKEGETQSS
jgi:hypothetical protein